MTGPHATSKPDVGYSPLTPPHGTDKPLASMLMSFT